MLRPIRNSILFVFIDDTAGGKIIPKTSSGIILTNVDPNASHGPKWVKVLAKGPAVGEDVVIGKYALVESMQWTVGMRVDDVEIWKTDDTKIMAVADEPQYQY